MDISTLLGVLAAFVLIAVNGYFVATEFALLRVRPTRIDQLAARGENNARVAQGQLRRLDLSLAATQLGITLAGLTLGWIGEPALEHSIEPLFKWAGGVVASDIADGLVIVISLLFIAALHTLFGEVLPKSIGIEYSERTLLFAARPLSLFAWLFYPFIRALRWIERKLMHALRLQLPDAESLVHSPEELLALVARSTEVGVLNKQEEALAQRIFSLRQKTAEQVMIPRVDMVSLPITISFESFLTILAEKCHTRYPVYEKTPDKIVGMVRIKDVARRLRMFAIGGAFDIQLLMRPILSIPPKVPLDDLLTQMQNNHTHMAIVINATGETAGIVTLEDVLEELVGTVADNQALFSPRSPTRTGEML